ncbi:MAG: hypothetical protein JXR07_17490 [Reichenbachiella sp.]
MKAHYSWIILFSFFISLNSTIEGQILDIQEIHSKLKIMEEKVPYDDLFLKNDKELYTNSDSIFFQLFLNNSISIEPFNTMVNVSLISLDNTIIEKVNIKAVDGLGSGYIDIPDNIASGEYIIVAYTNAMKNYSKDFYFNKSIQYVNGLENKKKNEDKSLKVYFRPEGGLFQAGIPNRIGIEITDELRKPISIDGFIINSLDKEKIAVKTDENGIGTFLLHYKNDTPYLLTFNHNNNEYEKELPKFKDSGISLRMNNELNQIKVSISYSDVFKATNNSIHLIFHHSNQLIYSYSLNTSGGNSLVQNLSHINIPNGVSNLVLLSDDFTLLGERLFYYNNIPNQYGANVNVKSTKINPRDPMNIKVDLSKMLSISKKANFTTRVLDANLMEEISSNHSSLLTHKLLTSEINDRITNPIYYFEAEKSPLINEMLISKHGSRLQWQNILFEALSDDKELFVNNENIILQGEVVNAQTKEVVNEKRTVDFVVQSMNKTIEAKTNENGFFSLDLKQFEGEISGYAILSRGQIQESEKYSINWKREMPEISTNRILGNKEGKYHLSFDIKDINEKETQHLINRTQSYVEMAAKNKTILESYNYYSKDSVEAKTNQNSLNKNNDVIKSDLHLDLDDFNMFDNMNSIIKEIVNNVSIRKKKNVEYIRVFNPEIRHTFSRSPLFIIDGYPTFDNDIFLALKPKDLQYIDVVSSRSLLWKYGSTGSNGVIVIRSKNKNIVPQFDKKAVKINGFQVPISRNSCISTSKNQNIPDFRSAIFWCPLMQTDTNGSKEIKYYHSDDISTFYLEIGGILDETRQPFYKKIEYEVSVK